MLLLFVSVPLSASCCVLLSKGVWFRPRARRRGKGGLCFPFVPTNLPILHVHCLVTGKTTLAVLSSVYLNNGRQKGIVTCYCGSYSEAQVLMSEWHAGVQTNWVSGFWSPDGHKGGCRNLFAAQPGGCLSSICWWSIQVVHMLTASGVCRTKVK